MASFAAAVRTANHWALKFREQFPDLVVAVSPKMMNATDAAIFVGICSMEGREKLPTSVPVIDETEQESSKEMIPLLVEFSGPVNPFHRQGHR